MINTTDLRNHQCGSAGTWAYDARGIPLCKVCPVCRTAKLSRYRREVLEDPNYAANEPIEEE